MKESSPHYNRKSEEGSSLAIAIIVLALMLAVAVGVLAVAATETGVAASDTQRTQAFYVANSDVEYLTNNFSDIFRRKTKPSDFDLTTLSATPPADLTGQGYTITQIIAEDAVRLKQLRDASNIKDGVSYPTVTLPPSSPLGGLYGSVVPYQITATATQNSSGARATVARQMNSYTVPLFQFGIFADKDIEFHPGPDFTFNGRIHSNSNLYLAGGNLVLQDRVTTANELVAQVDRNGYNGPTRNRNVSIAVSGTNYPLTAGSVNLGPNFNSTGAVGDRGFFPSSPNGTDNTTWTSNSLLAPANGQKNQFGGQVVTRSTGATKLLLPLQLDGAPPREIIKRPMPGETQNISDSRYYNKAQVRILIDGEGNTGSNAAGIPTGKGVALSAFSPDNLDKGKALYRVNSDGSYVGGFAWVQLSNNSIFANKVRSVKTVGVASDSAAGSGVTGRIYIEVVDAAGNKTDVTQAVLSMGVTVGEPNSIIAVQRPLWSAFIPGSRSRNNGGVNLADLINNYDFTADGEIKFVQNTTVPPNDPNFGLLTAPTFDAQYSFINTALSSIDDELPNAVIKLRQDASQPDTVSVGVGANQKTVPNLNKIVPISLYNTREGYSAGFPSGADATKINERGMTGIVEINMRNLSRWLAGYYDGNLLAGTNAVSSKINSEAGFVVYVSDRRGDRIKSEYPAYNVDGTPSAAAVNTTNGIVDNEDIYSGDFSSASLQDGEDVIDFGVDPTTGKSYAGTLQNDLFELPRPDLSFMLTQNGFGSGTSVGNCTGATQDANYKSTDNVVVRRTLATNSICSNSKAPLLYMNNSVNNGDGYFRRTVRLFNGEDLMQNPSGGTKISNTKGITVATENPIYIWGNYNSTGFNCSSAAFPASCFANNNNGAFTGNQVPTSIISDAFFPLSKTWFDALPAMFPDASPGGNPREADVGATSYGQQTTVRAAIISGNNRSGLTGGPDQFTSTNNAAGGDYESKLSGGVHNFPRFLENWGNHQWNYTGSLVIMYNSNEAMGPYGNNGSIYSPPIRNWSFDTTFRDPNKLPPGTPFFQFIEPTGFRQVVDPNPAP